MYSFATISIFATLAFSAFTSASPIAAPVVAVAPRADASPSIVDALTNLKNGLGSPVAKLAALTKDTATTATVTPLIDEVTSQIKTAISAVEAASDETVPLQTVTTLVAAILTLLIPTLTGLLNIVGTGSALGGILGSVGPLLATLLGLLIPIVTGLVASLVPLVGGLLTSVGALVTVLGLGDLISALGL